MARVGPQPAYVLHQWPWSESSLILDLFTREQGRVAVIAKGAKRPHSQLRSVLLPFQRIQVTLGRHRSEPSPSSSVRAEDGGDIHSLRTAEYAGHAAMVPPGRLFAGFYLNELLMKLLARHDAHALLFDAYDDVLAALAVAEAGGDEAALRAFELMLLRETGVLPELDRCTPTQEPLASGRSYALHAESGLVAAGADEPAMPAVHCLALHRALQQHDMAALRASATGVLPALKAQLRAVLHYHLGSPRLRTRELMIDLRRLVELEPNGTDQ